MQLNPPDPNKPNPVCNRTFPIGTKVYIFGYPASGEWPSGTVEYQGEAIEVVSQNLVVTEGKITGYAGTQIYTPEGVASVPPNYLTDAKVDAGNSGGLALAKINGVVCLVGMPTWVSEGVYQNLGIIQSFLRIVEISKP